MKLIIDEYSETVQVEAVATTFVTADVTEAGSGGWGFLRIPMAEHTGAFNAQDVGHTQVRLVGERYNSLQSIVRGASRKGVSRFYLVPVTDWARELLRKEGFDAPYVQVKADINTETEVTVV